MDIDVALSDEEEETLTAQQVLEALESAWLNEKFSPELLPHNIELVECMLEQIQQMEENLQKSRPDDLRVSIHRMELDRIRYLVTSYLRTRLEKIEEYTVDILEKDSQRDPESSYLSPGERKFAREYLEHMENHFRVLALRHMPPNLQDFDKVKMRVVPNLDCHIFLRANKTVNGVVIEGDTENGDEEVDLEENSQHIILYSSVAELVKNRTVQLI
ncbi:DNA replication complex GINS protein SLD5 [Anabrus simplex]|uniref:DNA replication complex GINS protein SLD5 n=1 Tax=Anabrus simplex TaxID=316456 RepID=UPI0035A3CDB4